MRYCGRIFSATELAGIQRLIAINPGDSRAALSRRVCELLHWYRQDGRLKDMSCRVAMLRMQDDGLIKLPPPRNGNNNGKAYLRRTAAADPRPAPLKIHSSDFDALRVYPVLKKKIPCFGMSISNVITISAMLPCPETKSVILSDLQER